MKKINFVLVFMYFTILFICYSESLYSQQAPMFTEYMLNTMESNPAYVGHREGIQITSMFRKRWTGFKTSPQSSFLSINMPIESKRIGLGVIFIEDRDETTTSFGVQSAYSFKIPFNEHSTLALGLQGGVVRYKMDFSQLDVIDANDPFFQENTASVSLNFGTGAFFSTKKFYISLSTPNLIQNSISNDSGVDLINTVKPGIQFYFSAGYIFILERDLIFKPSVFIRAVEGVPISVDLNLNLRLSEAFALGATYRIKSAIVGIVDLRVLSQLRVGYAYDYNTTNFNIISKGSHQIILRYEIPLKTKNLNSPKYF